MTRTEYALTSLFVFLLSFYITVEICRVPAPV